MRVIIDALQVLVLHPSAMRVLATLCRQLARRYAVPPASVARATVPQPQPGWKGRGDP